MHSPVVPTLLMVAHACLVLGSILHQEYAPRARISDVMVLVALLAVLAALRPSRRARVATVEERWDLPMLLMLGVLWGSAALQVRFGMDIGNRDPGVQAVAAWVLVASGVAVIPYVAWVVPRRGGVLAWLREQAGGWNVVVVILLAMWLKVDGIRHEPQPHIDVWEVMQGGARQLAHGENPYATHNEGAAAAGSGFGNAPATYVYPPSMLLLTAPVVWLTGDVRYAYVLVDLVTALLVLWLGSRLPGGARLRRCAELAALLVVMHPRSFAKAWNDPVILPFLVAWVLASLKKPTGWLAAVLGGLTLSFKQYLVFMAPLVAGRLKEPRRVLLAVVAAVATAVPFLLWDAGAFFQSTVAFHFRTPFRADGMTLSAFTFHVLGTTLPGMLGSLAALVLAVAGAWLVRNRGLVDTLLWASAVFTALFAGSWYAFPNYYHFVSGVLLIATLLTTSDMNGTADA